MKAELPEGLVQFVQLAGCRGVRQTRALSLLLLGLQGARQVTKTLTMGIQGLGLGRFRPAWSDDKSFFKD